MEYPDPAGAGPVRGGRVVPVYALTGGRTRSGAGRDMPVETLVTATSAAGRANDLQLEYQTTVELAARPISIVEIGAALGVPVGVARVLVSDLVDAGHLGGAPATADGGRRRPRPPDPRTALGGTPCPLSRTS